MGTGKDARNTSRAAPSTKTWKGGGLKPNTLFSRFRIDNQGLLHVEAWHRGPDLLSSWEALGQRRWLVWGKKYQHIWGHGFLMLFWGIHTYLILSPNLLLQRHHVSATSEACLMLRHRLAGAYSHCGWSIPRIRTKTRVAWCGPALPISYTIPAVKEILLVIFYELHLWGPGGCPDPEWVVVWPAQKEGSWQEPQGSGLCERLEEKRQLPMTLAKVQVGRCAECWNSQLRAQGHGLPLVFCQHSGWLGGNQLFSVAEDHPEMSGIGRESHTLQSD